MVRKAYDVDACITEIYDQTETQLEDVALLRVLLSAREQLRVLEPFCGNGRILIRLAEDGHEIVGVDQSRPMLASARLKLRQRPVEVRQRVHLIQADATTTTWPGDRDLVVLGANCLYELPSAERQEACIRAARASLRAGGHLFLDNNHMEGDLAESWRDTGIVHEERFPTGACADGTRVRGTTETIWYDAPMRLVRFRRAVEIRTCDGRRTRHEWVEQKHPPSTAEMREWLCEYGFSIEHLWGDRRRSPYTDSSGRAIFWATKR